MIVFPMILPRKVRILQHRLTKPWPQKNNCTNKSIETLKRPFGHKIRTRKFRAKSLNCPAKTNIVFGFVQKKASPTDHPIKKKHLHKPIPIRDPPPDSNFKNKKLVFKPKTSAWCFTTNSSQGTSSWVHQTQWSRVRPPIPLSAKDSCWGKQKARRNTGWEHLSFDWSFYENNKG